MSQATPRKFSEKIAILERKQNEEQEQFNSVMRDVRTITSTNTGTQSHASSTANSPLFTAPSSVGSGDQQLQRQQTPQLSPQHQQYSTAPSNDSNCASKLSPEGPHPLTTNWNRAGGSLPNVHQMVQQPMGSGTASGAPYLAGCGWSPSWTNMPAATSAQQQVQHVRTRSPGAPHFHPYRNGAQAGAQRYDHQQQRMSQGETSSRTSMTGIIPGVHLQPPDPTWSKARSDPAIHTAAMMTQSADPSSFMSAYPFYAGQNSVATGTGHHQIFNGPATAPTSAAIMPNSVMPLAFFPAYPPPPSLMDATAALSSTTTQNQPPPQQPNHQQKGFLMNSSCVTHPMASSSAMQQPQPLLANREMSGMMTMQQSSNNNTQTHKMNNNYAQFQNCNSQMTGGSPSSDITNNRAYHPQQTPPPRYENNYAPPGMILPPPMYSHPQQAALKMAMPPSALNNHLANNLTPANPNLLNQSQSAPSSPTTTSIIGCGLGSSSTNENPLAIANRQQHQQQQQHQWPPHRHFSASPDGMEVPNICVTGTDGSLDVDCFQDLQDLHLDSETLEMLKDPTEHEQMVDPACETQLLS